MKAKTCYNAYTVLPLDMIKLFFIYLKPAEIKKNRMYLYTSYGNTVDNFANRNNPLYGICIFMRYPDYSRTSMARISLGPWKTFRDMGSSSHWGLTMVPGQEANGDN